MVGMLAFTTTNKIYDQMRALIRSREGSYSGASLRLALSREGLTLRVAFGRIDFLGRTEDAPSDLILDYGDLVLSRSRKTVTEALDLVEKMIQNHTLTVDRVGDVMVKGYLSNGGLPVIPSGRNWGYVRPLWPSAYYCISVESDSRGNFPQHHLAKLGLPLYPDGYSAVATFCDLQYATGIDCRIIILVPDFRARICELRIKDQGISLSIESREMSEENLRAKFYCATEDGMKFHSEDLPIKEGTAKFSTEKAPIEVVAHILSTEGDDIDNKDFYLYERETKTDVVIEASKIRVEELAKRGEGLRIEYKEYKEDLPSKESELLESIVAFANTAGGTVLLGVNDNGDIVGVKTDLRSVEEKLRNWIAQKCDPRIEVKISKVDVDGKAVFLIDVPAGESTPYVLLERGVFVRTGGTDRQARRSELDQLYKRTSQSESLSRRLRY